MTPWEDRSAPHPTAVPSQPRNHAEIIGRIQGAEVNDPPGAPESGSGGAADRSRRAARTGPGDRLRPRGRSLSPRPPLGVGRLRPATGAAQPLCQAGRAVQRRSKRMMV